MHGVRPQSFPLVHGDFHCDNLLLDERVVCDWQNIYLGTSAGDLAFFLSRLSADGVSLNMDTRMRSYSTAAQAIGMPADAEIIQYDMTLTSQNVAFLFWHEACIIARRNEPTESFIR